MGTPRGLQQFRMDLEEVLSSWQLAWLVAARLGKLDWRSSHLPTHLRDARINAPRLALVA